MTWAALAPSAGFTPSAGGAGHPCHKRGSGLGPARIASQRFFARMRAAQ